MKSPNCLFVKQTVQNPDIMNLASQKTKQQILTVQTFSLCATRCCSSSVSQSVRMVSCVSNYLKSLITDTAANKPQSASCRGRRGRDERIGMGSCAGKTGMKEKMGLFSHYTAFFLEIQYIVFPIAD